MRKYLLDTDSVSYALRGQGKVGERIRGMKPSALAISALTRAELAYAAERKGSRKLRRLVRTFAEAVEVAPFDDAAAIEYGRLANLLAERGTPIGEFDALIAAHAISLRCTLVSNNLRHFSKVPGLVLENWV